MRMSPLVYLQEIESTVECDAETDLSSMRSWYANRLGAEVMTRVRQYETTATDEAQVKQAVWSALTWRNKMYYGLIYPVEKWIRRE